MKKRYGPGDRIEVRVGIHRFIADVVSLVTNLPWDYIVKVRKWISPKWGSHMGEVWAIQSSDIVRRVR